MSSEKKTVEMKGSDAPLFTGSCFCKAVSLKISALPRSSYICHCQDCRRFTGTSFAHNAVFPAPSVSLLVSGVELPVVDHTAISTGSGADVAADIDSQVKDAAAAATVAGLEVLKTFGNPKDGTVRFCGACAGRLLITCAVDNASMAGFVIVPAGVIDDSEADARLAPKAEFWCKRREIWMLGMRDTKTYPEQT